MPEGDTVFRAAQTLHRALAGRTIIGFESLLPALLRVDADHPVAGRSIEAVTSRGKHLLIHLSGDQVLHTHMRMNGAWHLYAPGERWHRPRRDMRVVVATADRIAVGFNVPVAEFLSGRALARHPLLARLGPDLASAAFDRAEVIRRMRGHAGGPIADLLLDQRVVSGIGNVLKSEILHVSGVNPFAPSASLSDGVLERTLEVAFRLMKMNITERTGAPGRRTTRSMVPHQRLWVYGRAGMPCRRCGAPIESRKTGPDARLTYWCPRCQA